MEHAQIRWWQRIIQRLAMTKVASSLFLSKYLHRMDATVLRWSKGEYTLTTMLAGLPVVVLTTTGARSGKLRTIPLAGFPDGEKIILIPSSFGSRNYPAWYHNLRANPQVEISLHRQSRKYVANIYDHRKGERYWQLALHYYPGFQAYQQRSGDREIRIVVLEPAQ